MLLAAAVAPILVANSPFGEGYGDLWHRELAIDVDFVVLRASPLHSINLGGTLRNIIPAGHHGHG